MPCALLFFSGMKTFKTVKLFLLTQANRCNVALLIFVFPKPLNMSNSEFPIKIAIADSQYLIVKSLQLLIQESERYNVVGVVGASHELSGLLKHGVDILITDPVTFNQDGTGYLERIMVDFPGISVIVLTNMVEREDFNRLNALGVKVIVDKTIGHAEVMMALDAAVKNRKYYSAEILELLLETVDKKDPRHNRANLTVSEKDIVRLIAEGMTTKEIASRKNISIHTVMSHRKNIFRKLEVNSSSELIMYAIKAGWIDNIEYYI